MPKQQNASFDYNASEREADGIAQKFAGNSDVVGSMSRAFGADLSKVRVHTDFNSARKAERENAAAYTKGSDVYMGEGIKPGTREGNRVLSHELAHAMQQDSGMAGQVLAPAPQGTVQRFFGFGRKRKFKAALRAYASIFNSRAQSGKEGMALHRTEKGVPTTPEDIILSNESRLTQGLSTNLDTPEYKKLVGSTFNGKGGGGSAGFSEAEQNDETFRQNIRQVVQPHIDRILAFDMSRIDLNNPKSLAANIRDITRAAVFNQPFGDLITNMKFTDLGGSPQIQAEVVSRLNFFNAALSKAKYSLGKKLGFKDDRTLYSEADYGKAMRDTQGDTATVDDPNATFSPDYAKGEALRLSNAMSGFVRGKNTFSGYQQEIGQQPYVAPQQQQPTSTQPTNTQPNQTAPLQNPPGFNMQKYLMDRWKPTQPTGKKKKEKGNYGKQGEVEGLNNVLEDLML